MIFASFIRTNMICLKKTQVERVSALLFEYARLNRLVLNPGKTKLIRFRPNPTNTGFIDGQLTQEIYCVKYLGVILQTNLAWDKHIVSIKMKIDPALGVHYKFKNK